MRNKKNGLIILEILAIMLSLTIVIPLYMIIINSFKAKGPASLMELAPIGLSHIVENYKRVIEFANLFTGFRNSIFLTTISVAFLIIASSASAFVIQRRGTKFTSFLNSAFMIGLTLPLSIVTTVYVLMVFKLNTSFTGFILVEIALNSPFIVFLYVGFYKGISRYMDESAIIDGCGPVKMFFNVILPLVKPVTITAIIISFMNVWNDLTIPLYILGSPEKYTVVLSTYMFYGERTTDWHYIFADIVMVTAPVVILYFILQRYIVSGMTAGAVKG